MITIEQSLYDSRFLKACRGEPVDATPIWLMRQAGRYMKEYQQVRSKHPFIELCTNPELACQVTYEAWERLGVDAAILFADLLPILQPMGFELEYVEKRGPVIHNPLRESQDLERVKTHNAEETMEFTGQAVAMIRKALPNTIPLIGFAGLPFTLAAYAIEGGGSKNYQHTKTFMYRDFGAWNALLEKIVVTVLDYAKMQIKSGCQAFQLFDSWIACLSPEDYRDYVLPHTKRLIQEIKAFIRSECSQDLPVIHFGTGSAPLAEAMHEAGADVLGVDWRTSLSQTWTKLGLKSIQGNLDPLSLFAPRDLLLKKAQAILDEVDSRPGHIFNLGHGILPGTPVENVCALVDYVHEYSLS